MGRNSKPILWFFYDYLFCTINLTQPAQEKLRHEDLNLVAYYVYRPESVQN